VFFDTERRAMRPDVVVAIVNATDFLNPSFERDLKEQVRYVLPPWPTLVERHAYIPFSGKVDLLLASVSNFYRYRNLIRSCLQDHVKFLLHRLRTHEPRQAYGIYADGYTAQSLGLPLDGRRSVDLEYYVHPNWIEQRGRVALTFWLGDRRL